MRTIKKDSEKKKLLKTEGTLQEISAWIGFASLAVVIFLFHQRFVSGKFWDGTFQGNAGWLILIATLSTQIAVSFMIRGLRSARVLEENESFEDALTGALNKTGFEKTLEAELRRAARYRYPLALCHINIDNFGFYKNSFDIKDGNEMLCHFANFLAGNIRFADTLARYDADNFFVLLPHTDIARAEKFLMRLLALSQERLDYGFSAGVTSYQTGETQARFLARATLALAQAKQGGSKALRFVANDQTVMSF